MKKAQIINDGCPSRTIELERVKGFLRGNGYSIVNDYAVSKEADLILYSTCALLLPVKISELRPLIEFNERRTHPQNWLYAVVYPISIQIVYLKCLTAKHLDPAHTNDLTRY